MPTGVIVAVVAAVALVAVWRWLMRSARRSLEMGRLVAEQAQYHVEAARRRGELWAQPLMVDPQAHLVSGDVGKLIGYFGTAHHGAARDYLLGAFGQGMGSGVLPSLAAALMSDDPNIQVTAIECIVAHARRFDTGPQARKALQRVTKDPVVGRLAAAAIAELSSGQ